MKLLGIDFGLAKIGLAIAEENFAYPFGVVRRCGKFISKIAQICKENQIEKIIVGLPQGRLEEEAKRFAKEISWETGIPVDFQDETLTTREAIAKMIAGGKKRKKRKELEDAFAAACILQEFLEERRESV